MLPSSSPQLVALSMFPPAFRGVCCWLNRARFCVPGLCVLPDTQLCQGEREKQKKKQKKKKQKKKKQKKGGRIMALRIAGSVGLFYRCEVETAHSSLRNEKIP